MAKRRQPEPESEDQEEAPPPMKKKKSKQQEPELVKKKKSKKERAEDVENDGPEIKTGKKTKKKKAVDEDAPTAAPLSKKAKKLAERKARRAKGLSDARAAYDEAGGDNAKHRLLVKGVSYKADPAAVKSHFESCGAVAAVKILPDAKGRQAHSGRAALIMADKAGYKAALALDDSRFMGLRIAVATAPKTVDDASSKANKNLVKADRKAGDKPDGCKSVIVKGLDKETTDKELKELFGKCGTVVSVKKMVDRNRCMAFVDFDNTAATDKAIKLSETKLRDKAFFVTYSKR
jgi:RNA recognition motif-containing protein